MMTFFSRFDQNPKKLRTSPTLFASRFPYDLFLNHRFSYMSPILYTYTLHLLSSRQVFSDQCHTTWPRGSIFLLGSDPSSHRPWEEEKEGRVAECSEELDSIPVHAP